MGISLETLALARKYADAVAAAGSQEALNKAVETAVEQSKIYTDKAIGNLTQFQVQIVNALPIVDIDPHTIYFVPMSMSSAADSYYEYMYIDEAWELIGTTQIDLSDYYTKEEVEQYIRDNKYVLPVASKNTLGGVKVDDISIHITEDGTIYANNEVTAEVALSVIDETFKEISAEEINTLF